MAQVRCSPEVPWPEAANSSWCAFLTQENSLTCLTRHPELATHSRPNGTSQPKSGQDQKTAAEGLLGQKEQIVILGFILTDTLGLPPIPGAEFPKPSEFPKRRKGISCYVNETTFEKPQAT